MILGIADSVNGVPIRLTDERWEHILDSHPEVGSFRETVLDAVENPDYIPASRRGALTQSPVTLRAPQRALVESAIRETCEIRKWSLWTVNVRTNHIHAVVTAHCKPERVLNAFKANSTRQMREAGCWKSERSPWGEGGSKRYLWTEEQLVNAIAYVQDDQGEPLD